MSTAASQYAGLPDSTYEQMYATWTGDPSLAPWTNDVRMPFAMQIGVSILAAVLTGLCVGLRFYVRSRLVRKVAFDDWILLAAWVAYLIYIILNLFYTGYMVVEGMSKAWWKAFELLAFWKLSFTPCAILVRAAIATFFLRSLPAETHRKQRWIIIILFWIYVALTITQMFTDMFQCGNPTNTGFYWYMNGTCMDGNILIAIFRTVGIYTVALDWAMTLVPVVLIWRSSLPVRAKWTSTGILCLAGSGSLIAIFCVAYPNIISVGYPSDLPVFNEYIMLRMGENGLGIMAVALAATRPLWSKLRSTNASDEDFSNEANPSGSGFEYGSGTHGVVQEVEKGKSESEMKYVTTMEVNA